MNFNEEAIKQINKVIEEKAPQMIEDKATKMIESIIEETFRWGDTKDQIKKKLQETINVNLLEFDLIDYNALIAKTINENLLQQVNLQPILDMTQDIIGFVNKKEIQLDEVAELFRQASMTEHEMDGEGEITFLVEENVRNHWIEVHADIEPDTKPENCNFRFLFSSKDERDGKIFSFKFKEQYYSERKEISPARMVALRGLEAQLFRLYSAQVKITHYEQHPSQYWDRY